MCFLSGSLGLQKHWEANLRKALLLSGVNNDFAVEVGVLFGVA